ncbi:glycosyltransferase [Actinospongicola halichondriae]|uniref:glycosyltransferase n=1 Tax=Actinospongicola halichondriae TaxID=3236844 RepID=UPI003D5C2600
MPGTTHDHRDTRTHLVHLADQRRSRTDSHGIINFSLGLTRALPAALGSDRLVVSVNDELIDELGRDFLRPDDRIVVVPAPETTAQRLALDHHRVLRAAHDAGADTVFYPKGFLPIRTGRSHRSFAQVICLHDDIPMRLAQDPQTPRSRRLRLQYFAGLTRWSMRAADRRLFVSDFSRRQLLARTGSERDDDVVTHEGIALPTVPYVRLADRRRQAVVLGSDHVHKRTAAGLDLIQADARCRQELDRIVVLGSLGGASADAGPIPIEHRPAPLADLDLSQLIAESRALVYPSNYEGFGLPPIEALSLGTPTVFRRTGASAEVLGDAPGAFADESSGAFAAAVAEALALDDDALERWREDIAADFDWSVVAERVARALHGAEPRHRRG